METQRRGNHIALLLIVLGISLRLMPHPANFAPMTAIALFGGSVLPRRLAVGVPLLGMTISDAIIGFYPMAPIVWGCYAAVALASSLFLSKRTVPRMVGLTLAASVFFFVATNFAVWASSGMYAHTWMGFVHCYALALPFFRNTLASDLIYTMFLFCAYASASLVGHKSLKTVTSTQ